MSEFEDDDLEEDEPVLWDELEERYGRPLTQVELRHELDLLFDVPMSDDEFEDELRSQAGWQILKAEIAEREAKRADENRAFDEMEATAEKLASEIFEIIFCEKSDGSGEMASFEEQNKLIKKNINLYSLFSFVQQCMANEHLQRTFRGHLKRYPAIEFVQTEWTAHRAAYEGNKSAFTRDYVKRVFNELGVRVTEKQMREVWLKDNPAASKQAG